MEEEQHGPSGAQSQPEPNKAEEIAKLVNRIENMTANEKIKLALTGDGEARRILLRNPNRLVPMAVLQNPRITESEVISIANSRHTSDEMLRYIVNNRDWYKLYALRLALVKNPKTPFAMSIRMVGTLASHDLKLLAKSKSIPQAVAQAARRLVTKTH